MKSRVLLIGKPHTACRTSNAIVVECHGYTVGRRIDLHRGDEGEFGLRDDVEDEVECVFDGLLLNEHHLGEPGFGVPIKKRGEGWEGVEGTSYL